jgi:hypothetical protein
VRHLGKYADSSVSAGQAFRFCRADGSVLATADSLTSFRRAVLEVDDEVLAAHAERGDFSRWLAGVFSAHEMAGQLRKTEMRWARGEIADLRAAITRLIVFHYGPDG